MNKLLRNILIGAGALVLLDAFILEKLFFQVKRFKIGNAKGKKRLKIILVSDLHLRNIVWPFFTRLAKAINKQRPQLIMIAGDILDSEGKLETVGKFFKLLNPSIPVIAIAGNHDHVNASSLAEIKKLLSGFNCDLLINETKTYQCKDITVAVTGLDDFINGTQDVQHALKHTGHFDHHFLLVHSPLQQESAMEEINKLNASRPIGDTINIGYIFAGHNHGGQVRIGNFVPVLPEFSGNYVEGWYNKRRPFLYLSKGFGTTRFPVRFGARSEMVIFDYCV